jgi:hypothetical protein
MKLTPLSTVLAAVLAVVGSSGFAEETFLPAVTPACLENGEGCREFEITDSSGTIADLTVFREVQELLEINGLSETHGSSAKFPQFSATLTIKL